MEQRYDVAKLLYEGNVYTDIVEKTGASSATISRVNRSPQVWGKRPSGGTGTEVKCGILELTNSKI